ncbi:histone acetyltransferase KAT2A-like [Rhopalosiphum maidis]|uniref:histone acetyltransferase KAT2A-like n=1 Tax=Rhopalosiphum maidis TaxID=43146 RepID=UPI000F005F1A|nr:histone acetyltransferase KAT2A-like [Rhopalosiphum maidis]
MGGALSRPLIPCYNPRQEHRRQPKPDILSIMNNEWKANDLLFEQIKSERSKLEEKNPGSIMRKVAKFVPCQSQRCKCKGGMFDGIERDNYGWRNSNCVRPGCNHPLSNHIQHLVSASKKEFAILIKQIFDIINIKGTIQSVSKNPKIERIIVLEEVFESIYTVLCKNVRRDPFIAPNINTIYGNPPFENTNINQILINFCMHMFSSKDSILELKDALIITKFVLRYFDTWMWFLPNRLPYTNPHEYSNSYVYYYRRYMMYCCVPRLVHSVSPRYKPSKIFGRDVLKYTLKSFKIQFQVWCYKQNIMWTDHTKLFCLDYLPKYMDLLHNEVLNNKSPIWSMNYKKSDVKRKVIELDDS